MEHRWGNRIAMDQPVRISSAGVTGSGVLRNLSVSGAFIETSLPLAAMTLVRVRIPRGTRRTRVQGNAMGFVVRTDLRGIGVEWCELGGLAMAVPGSHPVSDLQHRNPGPANDFLRIWAGDGRN